MGWFADEFQANVREHRRTWKRRLLRRFVSVVLVVLITPVALLVRHVTGNNTAGAVVAVVLLAGAIGAWWWIESLMYDAADERYFAELERQQQLKTPLDASGYVQDAAPVSIQPQMGAAKPVTIQAYAAVPNPIAPSKQSSGAGWAIFAITVVGCVLLSCGGLVGGAAYLMFRAIPAKQPAFGDDPFARMHEEHQQRMDEFARRHREMQEQMERDRERMRPPGW
jgi:hypothetical protein